MKQHKEICPDEVNALSQIAELKSRVLEVVSIMLNDDLVPPEKLAAKLIDSLENLECIEEKTNNNLFKMRQGD